MCTEYAKQIYVILASLNKDGTSTSLKTVRARMDKFARKMGAENRTHLFGATPVGLRQQELAEYCSIRETANGYQITEKGKVSLNRTFSKAIVEKYGSKARVWQDEVNALTA